MANRDVSHSDDARREGRGSSAAGNEGHKASPVAGDSPTHGTVEGPLAPQASPGDGQAEPESAQRRPDDARRKSDGVDELKKMEENAEAGRD